jgi:hypothetical protein
VAQVRERLCELTWDAVEHPQPSQKPAKAANVNSLTAREPMALGLPAAIHDLLRFPR